MAESGNTDRGKSVLRDRKRKTEEREKELEKNESRLASRDSPANTVSDSSIEFVGLVALCGFPFFTLARSFSVAWSL